MDKLLPLLLLLLTLGCSEQRPAEFEVDQENWSGRKASISAADSLLTGVTYLSSYSQIYVKSASRKFSLTGTISMRNVNPADTVYLQQATYYDTKGAVVRNYVNSPVYIAPMETVEIIINDDDTTGGTGDNFVFTWSKPPGAHDPFFEGVFISTYGQQGISFTTRGIPVQ